MSSVVALQQSLAIGPLTVKNRTAMASLTRSRAIPVDVPNDIMVEYYTQRAQGGVGLILSEGILVSPQGTEWSNPPGIYTPEHVAGWKRITEAVHINGSKIVAQLWHVGRAAHPDMPAHKAFGGPVSAPSPVSARGGKFRLIGGAPYVAPAREHPDPMLLVEEFRQAALNAKEAGFDAIEIHAANGYLVAQFLDPEANKRTDKWGGSLENRARFLFEVLDAVIPIWGADRVGIKLNPAGGYNDVGVSDEQMVVEFTYVINRIIKLRLGYIQLVRFLEWMNPTFDGVKRVVTNVDTLAVFGPLVFGTATKLLLNGAVEPEEANRLVEQGKIDMAVFGRPHINNPDYVYRIFNGLPLNEDVGHPLAPHTFYVFDKDILEGYTDYPFAKEVEV